MGLFIIHDNYVEIIALYSHYRIGENLIYIYRGKNPPQGLLLPEAIPNGENIINE